jgi:hypothetical protein
VSGKHARNSASSAHRWMECAGSVGEDGGSSFPAAAGTFAHDIAAQCLKDPSLSPSDFLLTKAKIDGFDVECDLEMVEGVRAYLDACDDDLQEGDIVWIEMPLLDVLQTIDPDLGGTSDYVRYRPATRNLLSRDFKYGAGVYVEVADNRQLKLYALGALLKVLRDHGYIVDTVTSSIVQPRYQGAAPVREETFKAIDLLDFAADVQAACERTRLPNPPLVAGDHCKFCPKARTCPELNKRQTAVMATKFTALEAVPLQELEQAALDIPLVKERIKAIESHLYKLALAGAQLKLHKLVDKEARRKWKNDGDVIMWAQGANIDPYAPREVLSPAQLEDKLKATAPKGKKKAAIAVLEPLYEKVSSGTVLVPITDERQPAKALVTAADFAALPAKPALY